MGCPQNSETLTVVAEQMLLHCTERGFICSISLQLYLERGSATMRILLRSVLKATNL